MVMRGALLLARELSPLDGEGAPALDRWKTQADLAEASSGAVTQSQVSAYMRGSNVPALEVALELAALTKGRVYAHAWLEPMTSDETIAWRALLDMRARVKVGRMQAGARAARRRAGAA